MKAAIRKIFRFIIRLAVILVLMLEILFMCITIPCAVKYAKYDETGIMKNGSLCISHMCKGAGGWGETYYNSDNSVLEEVKDFAVSNGIVSGAAGTVFGKVYKPINSGTSDIYVGYAAYGGESINHFELYHVEVDKDLNITYSVENISKEEFEQNYKGD